ncbi:MAG TPA: TIGR03086 family metal-binding protein [Candidatus Dormibacteraeota bacterium]|jgi:uncharacterized protein (TIGR03086 family)|nr:TIGR03086 family metal-binding protein [Candidatus Dormibacteraeota bacterium]
MAVQLDTVSVHPRAVRQTGDIIAGIRPDQLDAPTPCTRWTVRELVNHVVGVSRNFATIGAGGAPERPGGDAPDLLGDDPSAAYEAAAGAAAAAFAEPGALDRMWTLHFGDIPGAMAQCIHIVDLTSHAWDLARATGQTDRLDPEVGEAALGLSQTLLRPELRNEQGDPFAPEIAVAEGAPAYDRLAGFLGRQP